MFIAMNRFKVLPGAEPAFEEVWTSRDTHLPGVPGFVSFHLLKGPVRDDHVLYSSHTIWRDKAAFEALDHVRGLPSGASQRRRKQAAVSWTSGIRRI